MPSVLLAVQSVPHHDPPFPSAIMSFASSAVRQAKGSEKRGRPSWAAGSKLWNSQLVSTLAAKPFLAVPKQDPNSGQSSAAWEAFAKPMDWLSAESLAKILQPSSCELVNRPGVGLSELGATLETLVALVEGNRDVFAKPFVVTFSSLAEEHDLLDSAQILNTQDYQTLERSEAAVVQAVKNVLLFGSKVRAAWPDFAPKLGILMGATTGLNWVMQLAALTIPGAWPQAMKDVPNLPEPSKRRVLDNPTKGKALVELLAQCVIQLAETRKPKKTATFSVSAPVLSFSDTEDETTGPPPKKTKTLLRELARVGNEILALSTADMSAKAKAKTLATAEGLMIQFNSTYTACINGDGIDNVADIVDIKAIKRHLRSLKNA